MGPAGCRSAGHSPERPTPRAATPPRVGRHRRSTRAELRLPSGGSGRRRRPHRGTRSVARDEARRLNERSLGASASAPRVGDPCPWSLDGPEPLDHRLARFQEGGRRRMIESQRLRPLAGNPPLEESSRIWLYPLWKGRLEARLSRGSVLLDTRRGPVECSAGDRKPPLVVGVHGSPGGYDQIASAFPGFPGAGFRLMTWSRPGYLRTPLSSGGDFEEQADLLA